jgi:hypothetical protein
MWIEPPSISLTTANPLYTIGYLFNVTLYVNISTTQLIGAWQAKVLFDPTQLQVVDEGLTNGTPLNPQSEWLSGKSTFYAGPVIDNVTGSVLDGESLVGPSILSPGSGSLCWITFNVTKVPLKNETLSSVIDITTTYPVDTYVLDDKEAAIVMTTSNCDYSFTWEPPTVHPYMAVEHDGFYGVPPTSPGPKYLWPLYYGPYPPSAVNSSFDVNIYIEDLLAAWGLTSATFCLCYNTTVIDVMGGLANITLNIAVWDPATSVITITPGDPDEIDFTVYPQPLVVPSGNVLVATVRFTIMKQEAVPPYPIGYYDKSDLDFCDVYLEDHTMEIPHGSSKDGEVRILAIVALPMPWLEVEPIDTVLETEPCHTVLVGKEFDVNVIVKNLHDKWYVISYQFRLRFDPTLLQLVSITEGPFLNDSRWNLYGTFFVADEESDGIFGHHIYAGGILLPNGNGDYDQTIYPSAPGPNVTDLDPPVNPVLATIRFKAIKQECFGGENLTCALDILPFWWPENCHFMNVDGDFIPTDTAKIVNGTYTITPMYQYGRIIDVYGGATNRGYGTAHGTSYKGVGVVWPSPYGGQGANGNMDLVIPQSVVYLFAYVTYNCYPIQSKDVGYEIEGPFYQEGWTPEEPVPKQTPPFHVRKYANRTDDQGVAWIKFQMPWPCDNPEDYFGKYKVTVTVDICGVVVNDTLWFDYYYLVEITKVTTDKYCYAHCEDVEITIEFRSKAQQQYPVLLAVVIQDELETAFGYAYVETFVSGAEFCHWKEYTETRTIHVVKWAFAGIAKILVSAFDKDPTVGGAPWCPTYGMGWPLGKEVPEICIYPY